MTEAKGKPSGKPCADVSVLQEWDVVRRTAEFFDQQLTRYREVGAASSITVLGIALQFNAAFGLMLIPLNSVFLHLDRRSQKYLDQVTLYASSLEEGYQFAGDGLTVWIRKKARKNGRSLTRYFILLFYVALTLFGILLAFFTYLSAIEGFLASIDLTRV